MLSVKWVDTDKGTEENPEIRCRLVARDFSSSERDREDLFAAAPPWELRELLMSHTSVRATFAPPDTHPRRHGGGPWWRSSTCE